jgi:hypothetical protein
MPINNEFDARPRTQSGLTQENRARAQKASLEQQQHQLTDQLATARESAGRQETGQSSYQDLLASAMIAAADWLVFDDPAPPAPPAATLVPIRWRTSDWMFGDVGGRHGTVQ